MPERNFESDSPEATLALAESLGRALPAGSVLALEGELGSGKTTFVRGLAQGLEVEDPVSSPTYTLQHAYRGRLSLYHFDAWMEARERAFLLDGGAEWFDAGGVCVIEWAERVTELLPVPRLRVRLEHLSPERRRLSLSLVEGPAPSGLEATLASVLAGLDSPRKTVGEARGGPGEAVHGPENGEDE